MTFHGKTSDDGPRFPYVGAGPQVLGNFRAELRRRWRHRRRLAITGELDEGPSREERLAALPPTVLTIRKRPTHQSIVRVCAAYYGVSVDAILGESRIGSLLIPRHVAMYLFRELGSKSWGAVGAAFNRDHSTAINGWRRVAKFCAENPSVAEDVEAIKAKLMGAKPA